MDDSLEFHGAKVAILKGDRIVSILRDDDPGIAFPNVWDFPGGGREGAETPEDCVLREVREELSLTIAPNDLIWRQQYVSGTDASQFVWFFVAELPELDINRIRLGDEGQAWRMWDVDRFLRMGNVVPFMKERLADYLANRNTAEHLEPRCADGCS